MSRNGATPSDRLSENLAVSASGCWEWSGGLHDGYGRFELRLGGVRRRFMAHRLSYELFHGRVPPGQTVHHKCANRRCFNPDHLELATVRENVAEMHARRAYEARIAELEAALRAVDPHHPSLRK